MLTVRDIFNSFKFDHGLGHETFMVPVANDFSEQTGRHIEANIFNAVHAENVDSL